MTAPVPLVERLAEALVPHLGPCGRLGFPCGLTGRPRDEWCGRCDLVDCAARALLPVVEQAVAEGRAAALREAAKEAEERGDIGKEGGCEAWEWLRIRAEQVGGAK